jgi:hypothetical protein
MNNKKTIDIINELKKMFIDFDFLIVFNSRKNRNIHKDTLGCYTDLYYVKNNETIFLLDFLKNISDISDIPAIPMNKLNKIIIINSYLNLKMPSFSNEYLFTNNNINNLIFITPKDKKGYFKIYMHPNLYKIISNIK